MSSPLCHVLLYEPEIPPNTGNIIRLAANAGTMLHLIEPLGFALEDRQLRRAGLDYHEYCNLRVHANLDAALAELEGLRVFPCTTKASRAYSEVSFQRDDVLLFGPESRGLPREVLERFAPETWLRIPMLPQSRSLNLSNAVAVMVYEVWRQQGFVGAQWAQ